jgi:ABC-type transporter Mla subunit MlaD
MTMAETNIDRIQREVAETQAQSVAVIAALTAASANIAALSAQVQDLIANGATGEQLNALADALDATQKSVDSVLSPVEPPADVPADVPPADEGTPTP